MPPASFALSGTQFPQNHGVPTKYLDAASMEMVLANC
jgi:hypothetical protein